MKRKLFFIAFILGLGSLTAQSFVRHFTTNPNAISFLNSNDTLKVLAVMVDFQEDKYDGTIGTGKFGSHYTQVYGDTILDPLPHDAIYFSDHMEFAKNYFQKVSNGKVKILYTVLPEVITVSQTMREYVPSYNSKDFTPLGNFSKEVWELADKKFVNIKFSDYDLFIIFHAGVSSGLDDVTFSIDRNMPSLYLSNTTLKGIFGNQFIGFPANNGTSSIPNSIILPETESREQTLVDNSKFLIELTINGALVSNIASHLGLPDLFNTETGTSAIGRFGLMDGQAIIANSGMFPPEPSPWEKMYLDWELPTTLALGENKVSVATQLTAALNDTTLLKIPLNSTEYFLVENRSQDAKKDNVKITYRKSGQTLTATILPDTSGLFTVTPNSIDGGVVIDVDEFDAAVLGNGIVIWHIDEKIINEKLQENKINSDLYMKGVDVEEADGIQDIGEKFSYILGEFIGEGSKEDFWYKKNPAELYENRFSYDTKPNTKTNDGANGLITLENFSDVGNKMSFNLKFGVNSIKLFSSTKLIFGQGNKTITSLSFTNTNFIYITDNSNLYKLNMHGDVLKTIPNFSDIKPIVFKSNSIEYVIGAKGSILNIYMNDGQQEKIKSINCHGSVTAFSVDQKSDNSPKLLLGIWIPYARAYLLPIDDLLQIDDLAPISASLFSGQYPIVNFGVDNSFYTILDERGFFEYSSNPRSISLNKVARKSILTKDVNGKYVSVILQADNTFSIVSQGSLLNTFRINSTLEINSFALADLFNDGQNYIIISNGKSIEAYNFQGIMANDFPYKNFWEGNFIGTPLTIDFNRDGIVEIIACTDKGNIYAINPTSGKIVDYFPLSNGVGIAAAPILIAEELPTMGPLPSYKPYITVLDQKNTLNVWQVGDIQGRAYWNGEYGDALNNSFVAAPANTQQINEFFPSEKAYNWPNPVYDNETRIRYFVSESSNVSIKIFDLSGDLVAELNDRATGGLDNETLWNVSNVQSGIYYANIEIKSDSGKTAKKIIKIAVIK